MASGEEALREALDLAVRQRLDLADVKALGHRSGLTLTIGAAAGDDLQARVLGMEGAELGADEAEWEARVDRLLARRSRTATNDRRSMGDRPA